MRSSVPQTLRESGMLLSIFAFEVFGKYLAWHPDPKFPPERTDVLLKSGCYSRLISVQQVVPLSQVFRETQIPV